MDNKNPKYNPLYDPATDNLPIDPTVQKETINDPKANPAGISAEDEEVLNIILDKINKGEIKLYVPDSLINHPVYDQLSEESQGKADYNAVLLLGMIRQIKDLVDLNKKDSFQLQNLIHEIHVLKDRLESEGGDIFII